MTRPLDGTLVVSLEQAVAAPFCSSRLADAGARVIKIERAEGDFARFYDSVVHGESAYFVWLNRGKESLVLDIKDEADAALLQRILAKADVFIQNLAPGAAARAGLGSDVLRAANKRLITVDISGYGEDGAYADMKAYDLLVQAESGLCSVTGRAEGPGRVGVSACDVSCGMYSYMAVLEALIARGITGEGSSIKTSLFEGMADWMNVPLLQYDYGGTMPRRVGLNHPSIAPYGAYPTRGGGEILIAIQNEREFVRLASDVLERPDMPDDPLFCNNEARCTNRPALDEIIIAAFTSVDRATLIDRLRQAAIAFGEVNDVAGLSNHPALRRIEVGSPTGPVAMVAPPARHDGVTPALGPIPAIGEHSENIRREFAG
ncbi:MAG: CaiB/BaiF CoA-transferase family protein [Proteobacteria bacterium]|nr:CaiB/BaiF CoA-transferase family protein [Pseudomonadota bacterium]MDA1323629.1 CaiB/BaiF CoA-transferase family protein [Pseudomonadota bacterium]